MLIVHSWYFLTEMSNVESGQWNVESGHCFIIFRKSLKSVLPLLNPSLHPTYRIIGKKIIVFGLCQGWFIRPNKDLGEIWLCCSTTTMRRHDTRGIGFLCFLSKLINLCCG